MRLFKCNHDWKITHRSNILQQDDMGYPLRLFICKCTKCGKSEQQWLDVSVEFLNELNTSESFLLEWRRV